MKTEKESSKKLVKSELRKKYICKAELVVKTLDFQETLKKSKYEDYEPNLFLEDFYFDIINKNPKTIILKTLCERLSFWSMFDETLVPPDIKFEELKTEILIIEKEELDFETDGYSLGLLLPIRSLRATSDGTALISKKENEQFFTLLRLLEIYLEKNKKVLLDELINSKSLLRTFFQNRKYMADVVGINPNLIKLKLFAKVNLACLRDYEIQKMFLSEKKVIEKDNSVLLRFIIILCCYDRKILDYVSTDDLYNILEKPLQLKDEDAFKKNYQKIKQKLGIKLTSGRK
jgi:hypothetical protein